MAPEAIEWPRGKRQADRQYASQCAFHFLESPYLSTLTGMRAAEQFYGEVMDELEKVAPGCTKPLKGYKA